ncbi:hypothetical protein LEP1GSC125_1153 [Leptospira mayottensis 200901122]|uniref:Uncharacterized protein n=1 Tax=Leptospira mayottensis 200901122 TaxID=1193010 RepID=A0AA87SXQ5_9LEPT|nr:hypothetical protein LEP1GSC125_1153 [Leptospira mayottensis 200901122]
MLKVGVDLEQTYWKGALKSAGSWSYFCRDKLYFVVSCLL